MQNQSGKCSGRVTYAVLFTKHSPNVHNAQQEEKAANEALEARQTWLTKTKKESVTKKVWQPMARRISQLWKAKQKEKESSGLPMASAKHRQWVVWWIRYKTCSEPQWLATEHGSPCTEPRSASPTDCRGRTTQPKRCGWRGSRRCLCQSRLERPWAAG